MITKDFGKITFKASHNSYERNETILEQLTWDSENPYNCGCRGVEFDIWRHSSRFEPGKSISDTYFTVHHTSGGEGKKLSVYLSELKKWHQNTRDHGPVLLTLDIKSTQGDETIFPDEIDTYLSCYLGQELIFTPKDLWTDDSYKTMCEYVIKCGWPMIGDKFIVCLSGNKSWKENYGKQNPKERICFADVDLSASDSSITPPEKGNTVFFNFHIFNKDCSIWTKTILNFSKENLITRTYKANSEDNWDDCIKAGVTAIATDKVSNHYWAKVSESSPYSRRNS